MRVKPHRSDLDKPKKHGLVYATVRTWLYPGEFYVNKVYPQNASHLALDVVFGGLNFLDSVSLGGFGRLGLRVLRVSRAFRASGLNVCRALRSRGPPGRPSRGLPVTGHGITALQASWFLGRAYMFRLDLQKLFLRFRAREKRFLRLYFVVVS